MTDGARGFEKQSLTPSGSGDLDPYVAGLSQCPFLGLAICDAKLRYVSINSALAAMNGIPASAHIGKSVREIIGRTIPNVELLLRSVLVTGQSILNAEIRGKLLMREAEGYWIANYFPIRASSGEVKQVGALVIEVTRLREIERCILALMGNMPRPKGLDAYLGMPYGLESETGELWTGSIERVESRVREKLKDTHGLQSIARMPALCGEVTRRRVRPLYAPPAIPNDASGRKNGSTPVGTGVAMSLSPREVEIVQLLALGACNKEIASALSISVKTVETYRARIMAKLDVHSLGGVFRYAARHKLIDP